MSTDLIAKDKKIFFAVLVNLMIPLVGFSTDIYLPSLPDLSIFFGVHKAYIQLTVTSYVVALGISQLFTGPLSDAYGRKKLILVALLIQFFAIMGIVFSPQIFWMILFRFIQGVGAALMIVPARAIINDVFEGDEIKRQFNYCTISFALGPIVAPFIGGYIQHYIGWHMNFILLLTYSFVLTILVTFFYEETAKNLHRFSVHHLWKNYYFILKNQYFLICSILTGMLMAFTALFNVIGPFLVQVTFQKSAIFYGEIALLMGFGWISGNMLNKIFFRYPHKVKAQIALLLSLFTATLFLILAYVVGLSLPLLIISTFFLILWSGIQFPIYIGETLTIFKDLVASANGFLFSVIWLIFSLSTIIGTFFKLGSLIAIAVMYFLIAVISIFLFSISFKRM